MHTTPLHVDALRIEGTVTLQKGVLVLLGSGAPAPVERALFLPAERAKNLGVQTALAAAGIALPEREVSHDLDVFAALEGAQLERTLATLTSKGALLFQAADTELVGGGVIRGKRQFSLRRGADQVVVNCDPAHPLFDALAHWPRGAAAFEAGKLALVFAAVSAIPMILTVVSLVVALSRDEPSDWLAVLVWGLFVVFAWGGYAFVYFKAKRA